MRKLKIVPPAEKGSAPLLRPSTLAHRHLISLHDLTPQDIDFLLKLAQGVKATPARYHNALEGRTLAMIFEKPSLRTRVTFDLGISQLGGRALYLGSEEVGLGKREAVKDVARNLSRWVDVIVARVHSHQTAIELAEHATVPVINGLSDFEHPCQALGDYLTLLECKGRLADVTLAWVGDGNNVAHSLIYGAARLGVHIADCHPAGLRARPVGGGGCQTRGRRRNADARSCWRRWAARTWFTRMSGPAWASRRKQRLARKSFAPTK